MARFHLNFDRSEALKYQLRITTELLRVNDDEFKRLQKQTDDVKKMRDMITGCPDTWKPLLSMMKPVPGQPDTERHLNFQKQIVQFLKAKYTAITLMIEDQRDPEVSNRNIDT